MQWKDYNIVWERFPYEFIEADEDPIFGTGAKEGDKIVQNGLMFRPKYANKILEYTSSGGTPDSVEAFRENFEKIDPRYKDPKNPVLYKYNSKGYRTKEFQSFKDDEFIIAMGDSYTEGTGLFSEDLWHTHLGKWFDLDVCNIGMAGHGVESIVWNLNQWFALNLPKPKMIFIQIPEETRKHFFYYCESSKEQLYDIRYHVKSAVQGGGSWGDEVHPSRYDTEWFQNRFLSNQGQMIADLYLGYMQINNLLKAHDIPFVVWSFGAPLDSVVSNYAKQNDVKFCRIGHYEKYRNDFARDMMHPGAKTHQYIFESLKEFYNSDLLYDQYPKNDCRRVT